MGVNLTFKFLADHFEADRKHVKILVFAFFSRAGSQASLKGGGTTLKSDPPDAENSVKFEKLCVTFFSQNTPDFEI